MTLLTRNTSPHKKASTNFCKPPTPHTQNLQEQLQKQSIKSNQLIIIMCAQLDSSNMTNNSHNRRPLSIFRESATSAVSSEESACPRFGVRSPFFRVRQVFPGRNRAAPTSSFQDRLLRDQMKQLDSELVLMKHELRDI